MFIQTEETPNPATLKFLPGREVMTSGTAHFESREEAGRSPLAERLFQIEGMTPNMLDLPKGCAFGPRCHARTDACDQQPPIEEIDGRSLRCFNPQRAAEAVK